MLFDYLAEKHGVSVLLLYLLEFSSKHLHSISPTANN